MGFLQIPERPRDQGMLRAWIGVRACHAVLVLVWFVMACVFFASGAARKDRCDNPKWFPARLHPEGDKTASYIKYYLCKGQKASVPRARLSDVVCRDGTDLCYYVGKKLMQRSSASLKCSMSYGMFLATIADAAESKWISDKKIVAHSPLWLGYDLKGGKVLTMDAQQEAGYTNFFESDQIQRFSDDGYDAVVLGDSQTSCFLGQAYTGIGGALMAGVVVFGITTLLLGWQSVRAMRDQKPTSACLIVACDGVCLCFWVVSAAVLLASSRWLAVGEEEEEITFSADKVYAIAVVSVLFVLALFVSAVVGLQARSSLGAKE